MRSDNWDLKTAIIAFLFVLQIVLFIGFVVKVKKQPIDDPNYIIRLYRPGYVKTLTGWQKIN